MANIIEDGGGADNLMAKAEMLANAENIQEVNKAIAGTWSERTWKNIMHVRYNMMLSSVRTHAANIGGSTASGIYESVLIQPLAYANNKVLTGLKKSGRNLVSSPIICGVAILFPYPA